MRNFLDDSMPSLLGKLVGSIIQRAIGTRQLDGGAHLRELTNGLFVPWKREQIEGRDGVRLVIYGAVGGRGGARRSMGHHDGALNKLLQTQQGECVCVRVFQSLRASV
jgi:hypothetical protein